MRRFTLILACTTLAACVAPPPGRDETAPSLSLVVVDHPDGPRAVSASGPIEVRLDRLDRVRLEARAEDDQSGMAATRLRAQLRVVCRQPDGGTLVREVVRERDNSERDRPRRRTAAIDFNLGGDLPRLCPGGRYDSGEIQATATAVNGARLETRSGPLRLILPDGAS